MQRSEFHVTLEIRYCYVYHYLSAYQFWSQSTRKPKILQTNGFSRTLLPKAVRCDMVCRGMWQALNNYMNRTTRTCGFRDTAQSHCQNECTIEKRLVCFQKACRSTKIRIFLQAISAILRNIMPEGRSLQQSKHPEATKKPSA